jgi:hypothetical protein
MKRVVLISCVSTKLDCKAKAKDLYISPLFTMNYAYAQSLNPDAIYILSAKYGLVDPETEIETYNETLNTKKSHELKDWALDVIDQAQGKIDFRNDEVTFLAGENYRKFLLPLCRNGNVPMKGLGIGKQLGWLKRKIIDNRDKTSDHAKLF